MSDAPLTCPARQIRLSTPTPWRQFWLLVRNICYEDRPALKHIVKFIKDGGRELKMAGWTFLFLLLSHFFGSYPFQLEEFGAKLPFVRRKNISLEAVSQRTETQRAEWYLRIESVEQVLNPNVTLPPTDAFRVIAKVNGQAYSFPSTQPWVKGNVSECVYISVLSREKFLVEFTRQDFNQLRATRSITNSFTMTSGTMDTIQLSNLPAIRTNGLIIQRKDGELVGTTRIVYEISQ